MDVGTVFKFIGQGSSGEVRKVNIGDDWTDPFLGVRGTCSLNESLQFRASGDIGGFGMGSDVALQYNFNYFYAREIFSA